MRTVLPSGEIIEMPSGAWWAIQSPPPDHCTMERLPADGTAPARGIAAAPATGFIFASCSLPPTARWKTIHWMSGGTGRRSPAAEGAPAGGPPPAPATGFIFASCSLPPTARWKTIHWLSGDQSLANLYLLPTCGTQFYRHEEEWVRVYSEDLSPDERSEERRVGKECTSR